MVIPGWRDCSCSPETIKLETVAESGLPRRPQEAGLWLNVSQTICSAGPDLPQWVGTAIRGVSLTCSPEMHASDPRSSAAVPSVRISRDQAIRYSGCVTSAAGCSLLDAAAVGRCGLSVRCLHSTCTQRGEPCGLRGACSRLCSWRTLQPTQRPAAAPDTELAGLLGPP